MTKIVMNKNSGKTSINQPTSHDNNNHALPYMSDSTKNLLSEGFVIYNMILYITLMRPLLSRFKY